ncbi:hypothetical protein LEMLEM_LOCUS23476, partial [Lemmus lemmus]
MQRRETVSEPSQFSSLLSRHETQSENRWRRFLTAPVPAPSRVS